MSLTEIGLRAMISAEKVKVEQLQAENKTLRVENTAMQASLYAVTETADGLQADNHILDAEKKLLEANVKRLVSVAVKVAAWLAAERHDDDVSDAVSERIFKYAVNPLKDAALNPNSEV
jgi:predicted nuclease with TOPRIM domain